MDYMRRVNDFIYAKKAKMLKHFPQAEGLIIGWIARCMNPRIVFEAM